VVRGFSVHEEAVQEKDRSEQKVGSEDHRQTKDPDRGEPFPRPVAEARSHPIQGLRRKILPEARGEGAPSPVPPQAGGEGVRRQNNAGNLRVADPEVRREEEGRSEAEFGQSRDGVVEDDLLPRDPVERVQRESGETDQIVQGRKREGAVSARRGDMEIDRRMRSRHPPDRDLRDLHGDQEGQPAFFDVGSRRP